jgi:drug/metabolite transporter (DMT)-like permease
MIAAMAVFTAMDTLSKQLVEAGLPVIEIAWTRCVCQILIMLAITGPAGLGRAARTAQPVRQVLRGALMLGSSIFFVLSLGHLPIATATATGFVSPLFITALSIPLLGEKIGLRRWTAVIVGFAGVLVVVRPGGASFTAAALLPILSALTWAGALVLTRRMSGEPTETTFFYSSIVGLVGTGALMPFTWVTPDLAGLARLAVMGAVGAAGHLLLIRAFRSSEAALLAPFQYTQLIWATIAGVVIWRELPDALTYAGTAIIVASGLYIWARERKLAQGG